MLRAVLASCRSDSKIDELVHMHQQNDVTGEHDACVTTTSRLSSDASESVSNCRACDVISSSRKEAHGGEEGLLWRFAQILLT